MVAGQTPKIRPMLTETVKPMIIAQAGTTALSELTMGIRNTMALPTIMPMMPPVPVRVMASKRNCQVMSRLRAPMALRTPISRVRSVTETSMMFITPMPPMSRPIELRTTIDKHDAANDVVELLHHFHLRLNREIIRLVVGNFAAAAQNFADLIHGGIELAGIREKAIADLVAAGIQLHESVIGDDGAAIFVVRAETVGRFFKHSHDREGRAVHQNFLAHARRQ